MAEGVAGTMMRLLIVMLIASCSVYADDAPRDPWQPLNQTTHQVNEVLDASVLRRVAVGYKRAVPTVVQQGVGNVIGNMGDVNDAVNNLLQGKIGHFLSDLGRILINSSIGLAGIFDPATVMGMEDHNEDFGQTFARWGIPAGPYVVLPFVGPSTVRDGVGRILDGRLNPLRYVHPVNHRNIGYGVRAVHGRADLLAADRLVFGDRYVFYREAYSQHRDYLIHDGEVDDSFADDF
jgi:phospholipid-binding lipoprotein MlaA